MILNNGIRTQLKIRHIYRFTAKAGIIKERRIGELLND